MTIVMKRMMRKFSHHFSGLFYLKAGTCAVAAKRKRMRGKVDLELCEEEKMPYQMDVVPWCFKMDWIDGLDGMDYRMG